MIYFIPKTTDKMKLKAITYEQARSIAEPGEHIGCVQKGYNAAVARHKSKRDKSKRVDHVSIRLAKIENNISELKSEQAANLEAFKQLGTVIGEHTKDIQKLKKPDDFMSAKDFYHRPMDI